MFKWIKALIKTIGCVILELIRDLKSLRFQLIVLAYVYNFIIIYHTPENVKYGVALLATVYGFYFTTKYLEKKNQITEPEPTPRSDPDNIGE